MRMFEPLSEWAETAQRRLILSMFLLLAIASCSRRLSQPGEQERPAPAAAQEGGKRV